MLNKTWIIKHKGYKYEWDIISHIDPKLLENRKGIIYKFTNKVNGKAYIGKTEHWSYLRYFTRHFVDAEKNKYKTNKYFYNAIRKHGAENFTIEILDYGLSSKSVLALEVYYIRKYQTFWEYKKGYNLSWGGDEGCANNPEVAKKISNSLKTYYKNNPDAHPHKGKFHSEELKKRMGEARKGKYSGSENNKYVEVDLSKAIELYKELGSWKQVGNILGVNKTVFKSKFNSLNKLDEYVELVSKYHRLPDRRSNFKRNLTTISKYDLSVFNAKFYFSIWEQGKSLTKIAKEHSLDRKSLSKALQTYDLARFHKCKGISI
jgi:group I intron endonuclease